MSDGISPPVLIGEKVWWLGSGSGLPKRGVVRWIGRLPEIGPDWAVGIELEEPLPYGGMDGSWRGRELFKCKQRHGLIVPSDRVMAHQSGGGGIEKRKKRDVSLLPLQNQISAPPRLRRGIQDRRLLLDRHDDFHSVHLEAVQIHRRIQEDQVVSLVLGQASGSSRDVVLSRGMTRNEANVVPRIRRTESLVDRKEKSNSGLFSFFRWFRRENKLESGEERSSFSNPGSPVLRRSDSAITGSVDTLFSTATATSFAFVRPESYRPYGEANEPEKWIFPEPETNTYRNRIKNRDEFGRLNRNLSLREKYNLYASGSLGRSFDDIFDDRSARSLERLQPIESCASTLARKKRKAPPPPIEDFLNSLGCDSLPTTLSKESLDDFKLHRRTVSESAKYKKKPYHVKGKRKAPPPPAEILNRNSINLEIIQTNTSKKKRRAPPPPIQRQKGNVIHIPKEAALDVIEHDKLKIVHRGNIKQQSPTTATNLEEESTDTLRLEKGILKPNKMDKNYTEPKPAPTSPVSPRPWYKRPQSSGSVSKQNDWRKKESKSIEDWMLESGFPRRSQGLSIFNKSERPDDKRRSQISILTNISELDREAAEIIQRGKEREKSLLASYNAKYYVNSVDESSDSSKVADEGSQTDAVPKKATAKELISLFNSITNISRMTVNSHFIANEDLFSKNGDAEKRTSLIELSSIKEDVGNEDGSRFNSKPNKSTMNKDYQMPGPSGVNHINGIDQIKSNHSTERVSSVDDSKISRVTIEELDEYDSEKSNSPLPNGKSSKTSNPCVPVITEVTDTSMKSSSGSTICSSLLNDSNSSLSSGSSSGAKIKSSSLFSNYPLQKKLSMWTCSRCTLENPRWRLTCEACDMWRPTVCDYKLCKKPSIPDSETTNYSINTTQSSLTNNKLENTIKELDNETKNLIRNGQVLGNLTSQIALSVKPDNDILKGQRSEKHTMVKVPQTDTDTSKSNQVTSSRNESTASSSNSNSGDAEQAEVVRKARLAFFNKTNASTDDSNFAITTDFEKANMDNTSKATASEKLKLRELLKEIKNSLPRQKKLSNSISPSNTSPASNFEMHKENQKPKPLLAKQNSLNETIYVENTAQKYALGLNRPNLKQKSFDENYKPINTAVMPGTSHQPNANGNKVIDDNEKIVFHSPVVVEVKQAAIGQAIISDNKIIKPGSKQPAIDHSSTKTNENIKQGERNSKEITKNMKQSSLGVLNGVLSKHIKAETEGKQTVNNGAANVPNEKKAEAILVKSELIIEEIKVKKKPEKVSSSAQTSTKILPLEDNSKKFPKKEEVIVPVTVEEYTLKDKHEISKNSVTIEPMKIDVKKFDLMRPRDFTNVMNGTDQEDTSVKNDLQQSALSPSTPSSSFSSGDFNVPAAPRPSTSKEVSHAHLGTVALNKLLKRLEAAITSGQHDLAAGIAKELAKLKVPCSVIRQSPSHSNSSDILMKVIVEDEKTQRGPISIRVKPWVKLADLKRKMEKEHDMPINLQKWFIDKKLASDDQANVSQLGIEGPSTRIFLYLINPDMITTQSSDSDSKLKILNTSVSVDEVSEQQLNQPGCLYSNKNDSKPSLSIPGWRCESCGLKNKYDETFCGLCGIMKYGVPSTTARIEISENLRRETPTKHLIKQDIKDPPREEPRPSTSSQAVEREKQENYEKLVALEKDELVLSVVTFECPVCFVECAPPDGVVLKECLHSFCKGCLTKTIEYSEEAEVQCPYRDETYTCTSTLLEREIKALVTPEVYEEHLAKSIAQAETKITNAFHCKTPDCKGWCIYEDNVNLFKCPVCLHANCLTCQAIHEGLDCKQYQEQLSQDSGVNEDAKRTKDMLQEMVDRGEAMACPRCKVVLMKKWGCDWLRCSMCKTEICWVTRGPRWGPNGKGDTSAGCQCGVNGIKCHPKCNYCH